VNGADTRVGIVRETGRLVMFQHTVFALPFAVIALVTAAAPAWPPARTWLWLVIAMVAARTAAMAFNRLADHRIDAVNPRTRDRSLPAGRLSRGYAWTVTAAASAAFLLAAAMLHPLCLALAPPTLAVLLGYSFAKRFTAMSHLWLGVALGLAPVGAWIAATGTVGAPAVLLGVAVALWVAGFDVVYSLQDEDFDRTHGLCSLPAAIGARRALVAARILHALAFAGFLGFAVLAGAGWPRLAAVVVAGAALAWQHRLVRHDDLSRIGAAFFTANGTLAMVMMVLFLFARMRGVG
jgi:4-hydroxybenzoate polyprenyltransferase